ncbi:hypothetical protein HY485_03840 [Candidatus Woesearchaeota archaeon]|nr:hypothetical protein [Candidatus Woesearchaeota archaeon]
MQKWGVVIVLLMLSSSVAFAVSTGVPSPNDDVVGVTRITDFETDNVHILRIANFSKAVVTEIVGLEQNISVMQQQLNNIESEISGLKSLLASPSPVDDVRANEITGQLVGIEAELQMLKKQGSSLPATSLNSALFVLNGVILFSIFALFLFIRVNGPFDSRRQAELHAQLHLNNAVRNALKSGVPVEQVRQRFVAQGWNNKLVDSAIEEGVKR